MPEPTYRAEAFDDFVSALQSLGCKPRKNRDGVQARCPAHDDSTPSLSVSRGNQQPVVWRCHAGCSQDDVLEKVKPYLPKRLNEGPKDAVDLPLNRGRVWLYQNAERKDVLAVLREDLPGGFKKILQLVPHSEAFNKWKYGGLKGDKRPLLDLPQLLEHPNEFVTVVEGEKCFDAYKKLFPNSLVTTWVGGSKAWSKTDWVPLHGREVMLLADADSPGRECMTRIANRLLPHAKEIVLVLPPGEDSSDIADWAKDGEAVVTHKIKDHRRLGKDEVQQEINEQGINERLQQVEVIANEAGVELEVDRSSLEPKLDKEGKPQKNTASIIAKECERANYREFYTFSKFTGWLYRDEGKAWSVDDGEAEIRRNLIDLVADKGLKPSPESILKELKTLLRDPEPYDITSWLVGLPSGEVLELKTNTIRAARKDDRVLSRWGVNPKPGDKPHWDKLLTHLAETPQEMEFLRLFCGYLATGLTTEEKMLVFVGLAGAGKSTFGEALGRVFGDYTLTIGDEALQGGKTHPEWLARAERKRYGMWDEGPTLFSEASTNILKKMVTGAELTARHLYDRRFDFLSTIKVVMTMNDEPTIRGDVGAWYRRMITIPVYPLANMDTRFKLKLREEEEAIAAWVAVAASDYHTRFSENQDEKGLPPVPDRWRKHAKETIAGQDEVAVWCDANFRFIDDGFTSYEVMKARWSEEFGEESKMPLNKVKKRLTRIKPPLKTIVFGERPTTRNDRRRGVMGVSLIEPSGGGETLYVDEAELAELEPKHSEHTIDNSNMYDGLADDSLPF